MKNYQGIAPEAKIIALRVLDNEGKGTTAKLIEAINWVYTNRTRYNIRVVNLSLGTPAIESYTTDPLCVAVRRLTAAGIVVVAAGNNGKDAAGNKIYGAIHSPGNDPTAITVGATNTFGTDSREDDRIATFSSRGPTRSFKTVGGVKKYDHLIKPDLVAPGNKIVAARSKDNFLARGNPQLELTGEGDSDDYQLIRLSGTSMATPVVAGTVALMLQANPKLTPNMVKMILQYIAQPLAGFNHLEQGAGQLNVEGAIRLAKLVRQDLTVSPALGAPLLTGLILPRHTSTVGGTTFQWSGGITAGFGLLSGTKLITEYQKVYAAGMIISDGVIISDGMIISDGILQSDNVFDASSPMIAGDPQQ